MNWFQFKKSGYGTPVWVNLDNIRLVYLDGTNGGSLYLCDGEGSGVSVVDPDDCKRLVEILQKPISQ